MALALTDVESDSIKLNAIKTVKAAVAILRMMFLP
jgi:hypothetical protein